jgi:hypothetical protein
MATAPWLERRAPSVAHEDCRLARAIAVNPSRQEARPFGLRGVTAQRGPSKGLASPSTARSASARAGSLARTWGEGQKLMPDISSQVPASFTGLPLTTKSPAFLKDVYRFPLSRSVRETRNLPRISLSGSFQGRCCRKSRTPALKTLSPASMRSRFGISRARAPGLSATSGCAGPAN